MNGEWIVDGYALCPACGLYIGFEGTTDHLQDVICEHDAAHAAPREKD